MCIRDSGKAVEIQIRTFDMHRRAEYGVAAHWKYKEDGTKGGAKKDADQTSDLTWLRQLLEWQQETEDPGEFLDSLRFQINAKEVYVLSLIHI